MKTMHRLFFSAIVVSSLLPSCSSDSEQKEKADSAQAAQAIAKDSLLLASLQTISEIDSNLDVIRDTKGMIVLGERSNVDENVSKKEQILRNIAMINDLLESNKEKMAALEKSVAESGTKNKSLQSLTKTYQKKIDEQQHEIDNLKAQLVSLAYTNDELNKTTATLRAENSALLTKQDELNKRIDNMDNSMHTAWYTIGTAKQLREEKLISSKGLFGSKKEPVLTSGFDKSSFVEVSTRNEMSITLNSKKAKLMTSHPANSYALEKSNDGALVLHIKDPESFWSVSKYLIVETKS